MLTKTIWMRNFSYSWRGAECNDLLSGGQGRFAQQCSLVQQGEMCFEVFVVAELWIQWTSIAIGNIIILQFLTSQLTLFQGFVCKLLCFCRRRLILKCSSMSSCRLSYSMLVITWSGFVFCYLRFVGSVECVWLSAGIANRWLGLSGVFKAICVTVWWQEIRDDVSEVYILGTFLLTIYNWHNAA